MAKIEHHGEHLFHAVRRSPVIAGLIPGSPLLHAQLNPRPFTTHKRTPGLNEMFSVFDFEPVMFANVPQVSIRLYGARRRR